MATSLWPHFVAHRVRVLSLYHFKYRPTCIMFSSEVTALKITRFTDELSLQRGICRSSAIV